MAPQLGVQQGLQQGDVADACGTALSGGKLVTRNAFAGATNVPLSTRSGTDGIPPGRHQVYAAVTLPNES
jgi:hypothetical protein